MADITLNQRFMYYAGILAAAGANADDLKHISDLLEAEEQGLLIKLHFKIGDVVYEVVNGVDNKFVIVPRVCRSKALLHLMNDLYGERVFLTKEEAENALEALKKEV